jgi:hypothetical protein
MPSKSKKQRRAMAIAEHHPEKLYKRNKGLKKMSKEQLHEFATTKEKGLPVKKKRKIRVKRKKH